MKASNGIIMFVFQFTTMVYTAGKIPLHIFILEPISRTLLSGYASFHSTKTFAVRKYAFHEHYLAYALHATSYL